MIYYKNIMNQIQSQQKIELLRKMLKSQYPSVSDSNIEKTILAFLRKEGETQEPPIEPEFQGTMPSAEPEFQGTMPSAEPEFQGDMPVVQSGRYGPMPVVQSSSGVSYPAAGDGTDTNYPGSRSGTNVGLSELSPASSAGAGNYPQGSQEIRSPGGPTTLDEFIPTIERQTLSRSETGPVHPNIKSTLEKVRELDDGTFVGKLRSIMIGSALPYEETIKEHNDVVSARARMTKSLSETYSDPQKTQFQALLEKRKQQQQNLKNLLAQEKNIYERQRQEFVDKENIRQYEQKHELDRDRFDEGIRQFDQGHELDRDRFGLDKDKFAYEKELARQKAKAEAEAQKARLAALNAPGVLTESQRHDIATYNTKFRKQYDQGERNFRMLDFKQRENILRIGEKERERIDKEFFNQKKFAEANVAFNSALNLLSSDNIDYQNLRNTGIQFLRIMGEVGNLTEQEQSTAIRKYFRDDVNAFISYLTGGSYKVTKKTAMAARKRFKDVYTAMANAVADRINSYQSVNTRQRQHLQNYGVWSMKDLAKSFADTVKERVGLDLSQKVLSEYYNVGKLKNKDKAIGRKMHLNINQRELLKLLKK